MKLGSESEEDTVPPSEQWTANVLIDVKLVRRRTLRGIHRVEGSWSLFWLSRIVFSLLDHFGVH